MAQVKWNELDLRLRSVLIGVGALDAGLRIAALVDLVKRPAAEIRGKKWAWGVALSLVNSAGLLPATYFAKGRR